MRQLKWFAVALLGLSGPSAADTSNAIGVVELFTSHGCSSCPRADEALIEMVAQKDNFVALEFHVDYWDDLVWGSAGKWKDPYSKPEYSLRQYRYNEQKLKGRGGVYTPQSVVNGQYAMVGVSAKKATAVFDSLPANAVEIAIASSADADQYEISVNNPDALQGATIYLARFLKKTTTDVTHGENHGKQLHNINVVTSFEPLGGLSSNSQHQFTVASNDDSNTGCAVLVQSDGPGPMLGAALCPE